MLVSYLAEADGYYNPKTVMEEEDMKALLLWKLGGNRVAEINHRGNNAPSVSYLRTRSTVPRFVPSRENPTVDQVTGNVEATFEGYVWMRLGSQDELLSRIIQGAFVDEGNENVCLTAEHQIGQVGYHLER